MENVADSTNTNSLRLGFEQQIKKLCFYSTWSTKLKIWFECLILIIVFAGFGKCKHIETITQNGLEMINK
jgi:hypothetical protein